jgi:glucose-6-phosphate-specific signal transduction histidine kinase
MMENLDKDWIRRATSQNQALYNYLPPGNYIFKVRADNGSNTYSKNISELRITVHPPFWKTWWFFCLLALLVATVIYWLDKERVNKLVALQNVRSEIAGNLHEDVNKTLNNINLLSEMARIKADKEIDRSKEYIDQISTKSHNMIIAMDDILWSIDPQNDTMEKSLLRMMEFADSLKNRHASSIEISIDKKVRSLNLDMKTRHEAFLIFKQALTMIVVYSSGKQTLIKIDLFKNKLAIRLHDQTGALDNNLAQIDETIKEMNSRAELIAADLDVQYDKNGIAVVLLVPVK